MTAWRSMCPEQVCALSTKPVARSLAFLLLVVSTSQKKSATQCNGYRCSTTVLFHNTLQNQTCFHAPTASCRTLQLEWGAQRRRNFCLSQLGRVQTNVNWKKQKNCPLQIRCFLHHNSGEKTSRNEDTKHWLFIPSVEMSLVASSVIASWLTIEARACHCHFLSQTQTFMQDGAHEWCPLLGHLGVMVCILLCWPSVQWVKHFVKSCFIKDDPVSSISFGKQCWQPVGPESSSGWGCNFGPPMLTWTV